MDAVHFLATCQYMCFHVPSTGWICHLRSNRLHLRSNTQQRDAGTSWMLQLHCATAPVLKKVCSDWCISHIGNLQSAHCGGTRRVEEAASPKWRNCSGGFCLLLTGWGHNSPMVLHADLLCAFLNFIDITAGGNVLGGVWLNWVA